MANIKKFLQKELEKGGRYVVASGEILTEEKLDAKLKAQYISGLRTGEVDVEQPFVFYKQEWVKKNTLLVEDIMYGVEAPFAEIIPEENPGTCSPYGPIDDHEPVEETPVAVAE